jgi:hypothetical protein
MASSDAFELQKSGLNDFLFAEVGNEENGYPLTILSVLARLGQDPWTESARWARLPKAAVIDCLTDSIVQMPLCPQALADARATAGRLILLLPSEMKTPAQDPMLHVGTLSFPEWVPLALFGAAVVVGIMFGMVPPPAPIKPGVATSQPVIVPPGPQGQ